MSGRKGRRGESRGIPLDEVPGRFRRILSAVPVRNEARLKWVVDDKGLVTITHAKNLKGWEVWLMKRVGGSATIRRKLDEPGSDIWMLCDGSHDVAAICGELDQKYKERIEPVLSRVTGFLEILLSRGLIMLKAPAPAAPAGPGPKTATRSKKGAPPG